MESQHLPPYFKRIYLLTDLVEDVATLLNLPHGLLWGIVNNFRTTICGKILLLKHYLTTTGEEALESAHVEWDIIRLLPENSAYLKLVVAGSEQHLNELFTFLLKYQDADVKLWSVHEIESVEIEDLPLERKFEIINGNVVHGINSGPASTQSPAQRSKASGVMENAEVGYLS